MASFKHVNPHCFLSMGVYMCSWITYVLNDRECGLCVKS